MKNIHILPTDNPSRLCLDSKDVLWFAPRSGYSTADGKQNIYITSDEEIKEGDWFITTDTNEINKSDWIKFHFDNGKKIILTTNQDLIKDGVQAIDDEFLEWFVKNSSCEEVEVVKEDWKDKTYSYEIIIPKEEPKQESLSWDELIREAGSEEQLIKILKLPHIVPLVREAMRSRCKK